MTAGKMDKTTVVLGMGSVLMTDEGVGVQVVRALQQRAGLFHSVDFVDAGTAGVSLVHRMRSYDRAIFVDCTLMGEEPGAIRRFSPDEVRSSKQITGHSRHEGDLLHFISLSERLGEAPPSITIFGIQPFCIESGTELSPMLAGKLDYYVEQVSQALLED